MDKVYKQLLTNMKFVLRRARKISLSADIWTKRGMTESKLGMTARLYDPHSKVMRRMTLACRTFPPPHTAARLFKLTMDILAEWDIAPSKISAIVTDNGSNMVAAFKAFVDSNGSDSHNESDEDEEGVTVTSDDTEEANVVEEVDEYMQFEEQCDREFDGRIKRHSCTIHRLQTAVRVFEKDETLKPIIRKARVIVKTFRMSTVATGELIKATNLTLIADVSTRWNSTLLFLKRLDLVQDSVKEIMARHLKIPGLTPGEWVTDKLSADKEATIHRVHFYINGLVRHLECIRDALSKLDFSSFHLDNPFDQVILAMESELSRVLGYVINERDPKFDAVYIASTFLHKKLRLTLPHRVASLASRWLALKSSDWYEQNIPDILPEPADPNVTSKFNTDDDLDFFVAASLEVAPHNSPFDLEIQTYISLPASTEDNTDDNPELFWIQNAGKFPLLSRVALDILAIPAGSSAPERVFSIGSAATMGKGNRLAGHNLERKILSLRNTEYLSDLDD
ncbi:hypothetical protein RvY_11616-1 [Ramazzottius varieornatus]|uniref:HAT C-terminal dimerisation domain-containing protein n=1 Tax=Ramazzottius varieornatus TaxID=947166 RepID=A0A1D1VIS0_RAMVA|nr:hypothetical protein RvY_11616-1 [Ramazzottius varieornatus]